MSEIQTVSLNDGLYMITPIDPQTMTPINENNNNNEEEKKLIHIRVSLNDRKDIDMAMSARNQSMQEYFMDLLKEDMKKNKDKYINIYNTMNSFRKDFK